MNLFFKEWKGRSVCHPELDLSWWCAPINSNRRRGKIFSDGYFLLMWVKPWVKNELRCFNVGSEETSSYHLRNLDVLMRPLWQQSDWTTSYFLVERILAIISFECLDNMNESTILSIVSKYVLPWIQTAILWASTIIIVCNRACLFVAI